MFHKILFTFFLLCAAHLCASDYVPAETLSQIGRYQIVLDNSYVLYLVDTTNGKVWRFDDSALSWDYEWNARIPPVSNP